MLTVNVGKEQVGTTGAFKTQTGGINMGISKHCDFKNMEVNK